jgi:predicted nucleic acid-binding protein
MKKTPKPDKKAASAFVLDCSIALAWCFPDEKAPYPRSVLDALLDLPAVVPALWRLEVANCLLVGERRKRSTAADTATWLPFLQALPVTVDGETTSRAWNDTLGLARNHNLSVYDAAYLELSLRRGLPLATLDDKLAQAAKACGVIAFMPFGPG